MMWLLMTALVAAILLVGLGFAAFWPTFPPKDDTRLPSWMTKDVDTGERPYVGHRRAARYRDVVGVEGTGPATDMKLPPAGPVHPRFLSQESTQRLRPSAEIPGDRTQVIRPIHPPPEWPPRRSVK
jgi:hypothetical protein